MVRHALLLLIIHGLFGATVRGICGTPRKPVVTIEAVRAALASRESATCGLGEQEGKGLGKATPSLPFSLAGYNFHWEIAVGKGIRVIIVSRNLGGTILVFDPQGNLRAKRETPESISVFVFDFDGDGIAELVSEEEDGRGTGVIVRSFRIRDVSQLTPRVLWQGRSLSYGMEGPEDPTVQRGFIRCERSGLGIRGKKLFYLLEEEKHGSVVKMSRFVYIFENGAFKLVERTSLPHMPLVSPSPASGH